jgi:hypothetical protein
MADHDWAPDPWEAEQAAGALDVRHVQPYEALKPYRCPECDHDIRVGEGHEVVVPRHDPEARRHWHSACWRRVSTRNTGGARRKKR